MTTADDIEEALRREGFGISKNEDLPIMFRDYIKDVSHNITLRNIRRTIRLFKDVIKWVWNKNGTI